MTDFNTLRIDLIRRLSLCGAWDGKLYWYKDTIQLLKKMMQFVPPKTNADRIRAMTDEELAQCMDKIASCEFCPARRERCGYGHGCIDAWLEWLKQEAQDEHTD